MRFVRHEIESVKGLDERSERLFTQATIDRILGETSLPKWNAYERIGTDTDAGFEQIDQLFGGDIVIGRDDVRTVRAVHPLKVV